jgi:predicted transposase YbfD/YdcC
MDAKKSLIEHLTIVRDPRVVNRSEHRLIDILVITILAVLCGCDDWVEIEEYGIHKEVWLKEFLELPSGIPSHDTFGRVFALLDPEKFHEAFYEWVKEVNTLLPREIISIDGKFLRGALREAGRARSAIGIVSAWASEAGVVLAQRKTELKKEEGEKRATEELLKFLDVRGCIVTLDANGATTKITEKIVEKGGDYVIGLKANQKALMTCAESLFKEVSSPTEEFTTKEKRHGRVEKRTYQLLKVEDCEFANTYSWEKRKEKWTTLKSFGRVITERKIHATAIATHEVRYYFTNLKTDVTEFANAVRSHWKVENNLHWVMDVAFREDHCRARIGHSAENLSLIRRMTLNLLKKDTRAKKSIKVKRLGCSLKDEYAFQVLTGRV